MLTSDPIYKKPYKPRIEVNSVDNAGATNFYTYDPWTDSGINNKPVSLSVALSENNWGTFVIQIEDNDLDIDVYNIANGNRVKIQAGKQSTQMTTLVSGLIRKTGYSRGANSQVILNLYGSTTGIRLNERVLYLVQEANKLAFDDTTLDLTDPAMVARTLLKTGLVPITNDGIISASTMDTDSDVQTVVPSVAIEYGEAMDLVNLVEDATGAYVTVDTADKIQLRHEIRLPVGGRGFTVKNEPSNISLANDDADDTCYLRGKSWNVEESVYKADSFGNRLYSILQAQTTIPSSLGDLASGAAFNYVVSYVNNETNTTPNPTLDEWGMKFRPTHSHFIAGDFMFGLNLATTIQFGPKTIPVFRIIKDSGGLPLNTSGTVATLKLNNPPDENASDSGRFDTDFIFFVGGSQTDHIDLDSTLDYWMVLTDDNAGWDAVKGSYYWSAWIKHPTRTADMVKRTTASGTATSDTNGGTGWVSQGNIARPLFEIPRRRSHSMVIWDRKSIMNVGGRVSFTGLPIDSVIQTTPSYIRTREAWYKWMFYNLYYMARPRSNFSMPKVSAPNVPILPGDPLIVSDAVLGYSTPGEEICLTRCGDMNYNWNSFGGKGDSSAPPVLTLNPVGQPLRYK